MESYYLYSKRITPEFSEISLLRQFIDTIIDELPQFVHLSNPLKEVLTEWSSNIIRHAKRDASAIFAHIRQVNGIYELVISDDSEPFFDYLAYQQRALTMDSNHQARPLLREDEMGLYIISQLFPQWLYFPKNDHAAYNEFVIRLPRGHSKHRYVIALLEENNAMATSIMTQLQPDYEVVHFPTMQNLLSAIEHNGFDLILSSLELSHRAGIKLKLELSKTPRYAVIPFICMAHAIDEELEQQVNQLGVDAILHQPIDKNTLCPVIERILQRSAMNRSQLNDELKEEVKASLRVDLPKTLSGHHCLAGHRQAGIGGGDFILSFSDKGSSLVMLCDVMGHGISASLLSHAYVGYLKGIISTVGIQEEPGKLLACLSEHLQGDEALQSVIMTCVAVLIKEDGLIEIANAGHPFPLHINEQGMHDVHVPGRLLGISSKPHYYTQRLRLAQDETLVLYTDGLLEEGSGITARASHARAIQHELANCYGRSLDESMHQVMVSFDAYTQLTPRDDATVIMIKKDCS